MRTVFALLVVSLLAAPAPGQTARPTSFEQKAYRLSLWGTLVPVAAGSILWVTQASHAWASEGPDRTGAALLVAGGLTLGPSFGYNAAGLHGRGLRGVGLRAGVTLLSLGTAFAICGWNCSKGDAAYEVAWVAFATGSGLSAVSALYDIARVRHNVRRHEARSDARVSLVPLYVPGERALGVRLAFAF